MKLSFSTLSCPEWTWEKVVNEAVRLNFHGIEIRGIAGEMRVPQISAFLPENLEKTLEKVKREGLEICILDTSCRFDDINRWDANMEEGKDTIDLAQRMGVPYVRVFGDRIPDLTMKDNMIDQVSRGIQSLCDYSRGKGVTILQETHGDFSNLENLLPVLEKVQDPQFGILWDIEHTYKCYGDHVEEFFEKTWKYIKHVHIKDVKRVDGKFQLCLVGEGDVPIDKVMQLLEQVNYTGYLSLEWEKKWKPELEEPEIVIPAFREYMKRYEKSNIT